MLSYKHKNNLPHLTNHIILLIKHPITDCCENCKKEQWELIRQCYVCSAVSEALERTLCASTVTLICNHKISVFFYMELPVLQCNCKIVTELFFNPNWNKIRYKIYLTRRPKATDCQNRFETTRFLAIKNGQPVQT